MASDTNGKDVFIEQAHFYVDASHFKKKEGCAQAETPVDVDGRGLIAEREGGGHQE